MPGVTLPARLSSAYPRPPKSSASEPLLLEEARVQGRAPALVVERGQGVGHAQQHRVGQPEAVQSREETGGVDGLRACGMGVAPMVLCNKPAKCHLANPKSGHAKL